MHPTVDSAGFTRAPRRTSINGLINESGVQTSFVSAGLVYLRTLELETAREADGLRVRVLNHDNGDPMVDATVHCEGCDEALAVRTDGEGWAVLAVDADQPVVVQAEAEGFNPQTVAVP